MNLFTKLMAGKMSPDDFLCTEAQELFLGHVKSCPVCQERLRSAFREIPMLAVVGEKILGDKANGKPAQNH